MQTPHFKSLHHLTLPACGILGVKRDRAFSNSEIAGAEFPYVSAGSARHFGYRHVNLLNSGTSHLDLNTQPD